MRVVDDVQVKSLERLRHFLGLARGRKRVRGLGKGRPQPNRLVGQGRHECLEVGRVRARLPGGGLLVPTGELGGEQARHAGGVPQALVFGAAGQALGKKVDPAWTHQRRERRTGRSPAAGHVEVSRDGLDEAEGHARPMAVRLLVANSVAVDDAHGPYRAHQACDVHDGLFGQAGPLRRPRGREPFHMARQVFEAEAPVAHEIVVIEAFAYDDVQDGERQRAVGSRTHRKPHVRPRRERIGQRTDVDDPHAGILRIQARCYPASRHARVFRVRSPVDQQLRLVQLSGRARGPPDGHVLARTPLQRADAAVQVVGATVHVQEAPAERPKDGKRLRRKDAEAFRAVVALQACKARGNVCQSLVPRAALEGALAAGARHPFESHALQRVAQATGILHHLDGRIALRTQRAARRTGASAVVASLGVPFHGDPFPVDDMAQRRTVGLGRPTHLAPCMAHFVFHPASPRPVGAERRRTPVARRRAPVALRQEATETARAMETAALLVFLHPLYRQEAICPQCRFRTEGMRVAHAGICRLARMPPKAVETVFAAPLCGISRRRRRNPV